ncbi:putative ribonuclease H protein [Hibiscus syriacus]|uniref:Ribonuclease H protein n=1 Tax=Hibiscus syriacus TaxID=106335 RepID=A0A6A2XS58_HIBSY|nr:putative ribonuclease H protein [Hibiscus syriacus]
MNEIQVVLSLLLVLIERVITSIRVLLILVNVTKVHFKTAKHNTEGILDYVHPDVWGPSTISSLGGSRLPRESLAGKVEEEVWTGHDVSFDNLRIFGYPTYVLVPADERSKLDAKSKECIFLGYNKGVKGFKFWDPVAKKIVIIEKPETSQPTSGGSAMDDLQDYSLTRDRVRRTNIKPSSRLGFEDLVSFALTVSSDDLVTFHDVVTSQENDKWMAAMVEEMESLNHNRTWELVPLLEGKKPIGFKWVHTSIRAVLALVASWDLHLEQMDVKTAFLHGDLEEQIYMRQPEGFTQPGNEHLVCRLKKSFLDDGSFIFLLLYVDDMFIAAKNMDDVIGLKTLLSQEFDMKDLGAVKKILGMEICRDRDSRKLWLSQRDYVEKMLERFAMSSAKPVSTPLANHFKLSLEQCPKTDKEAEDMAKVSYSNAVGCLMYAMVCTRPDLAHVVSQVCKYMSKPGKQYWEAVKWIFRYLKGTVGHGMVFGSQRDNPLVVGYVDSDYAGDLDNRRSTTGYVFTLGGGPICWKSTVQSVVALSATEVEYMEAAEAAKEVLWLTGLVKELGVQQGGV